MILLTILSTSAIFAPHVKAEPNETAPEVAEKAATWILSQAIPEAGGYKWEFKSYWGRTFYESNVQWGSAGFGKFFLALYETTGNSLYLDYAEGAAKWVISQAVPASGGYKWAHPDDDIPSPGWWLSPTVSGIAEFLLRMYQTTGDSTYLDYAKGAAKWLMAMAYWGEPGCFIPYNPPGRYGTQAAHGIGPGREAYTVTFLLHLYQETGDATYLPYVEGTATWLMSGPDKVAEGGGYKWRHGRPYGSGYSIDGNGRIATFFYEIYQALGKAEYLDYANKAMTWLLSQAVVVGDKAKWPESQGSGSYPTLPFAGSFFGGRGEEARVCDLLMVAYEVTGDAAYLEYAKKLANWVISPAVAMPEGGGYKFPYYEGGSYYDVFHNARVYNFLSWMYDVAGETSYSEYADGALTWIIYKAEEVDGGYKWRTLDYSPYYATWFSGGAAGIGYYLTSVARPTPQVPIYDIRLVFSAASVSFGSEGESYYPVEGLYFDGDENIENNAQNYRERFSDWRPHDLDGVIEPFIDGDAASYVFVKEDGDFIVYQYWIYYAYNFKTRLPILKDLQNHEHDFEYIFVWADKDTSQIRRISLNQHLWANNYEFSTPPEFPIFIAVEQGGHGMIMLEPDNDENGFPDDLNMDGMFDIRRPDNSRNFWPGMNDPTKIGVYTGGSFVAKLYPWKVYDGSVSINGFGNDNLLRKGVDSEVLTPFFWNIPGDIITDSFDSAMSAFYNDVLLKASEPQQFGIKDWKLEFYVRAPWKRSVLENPERQWSRISFELLIEKELIKGIVSTIAKGITSVLTEGMRLGIVPPFVVGQITSKLLGFIIDPAEATVIDSQNNALGYMDGDVVSEIPGSFILFESDSIDLYFILNATGDYSLKIIGEGNYDVTTIFAIDGETMSGTVTGEIVEGVVHVYRVSIIDETIDVEPDPIAELGYLNEFIDGLTADSFDKPNLASQRKNVLFNKIDEVILKVEAGNYTDAINKLLHDIRAKMDGDRTAMDWITDPMAQFKLCIIIDYIISNIQTLQKETG